MKNYTNKNYTSIWVNPVQRESVQGRSKQVYTILGENNELIPTRNMSKNREFGTAYTYVFPYNPETRRLVTGLDELIANDFFQQDADEIIKKYDLPEEWRTLMPKVVTQDKIKRQTLFEILDKTTPDYYTSAVNGSVYTRDFTKENVGPANFLQSFNIVLYDHPNYFDDTTARGRLSIQLCKVHDKIAEGKNIVNSAIHTYYISQENEAAYENASRQDIINKAIYHLYDLTEKSNDFKAYQVSVVLKDYQGIPLVKGSVSPLKVKEKLNAYIHGTGKTQLQNAERFIDVIDMLGSKEGSTRFKVMYVLQQAMNEGIMSARDGFFVWHSKADHPNVYKFNAWEKLVNFMLNEMRTYNPKEENITNYYKDLVAELDHRKVRLEV